MDKVKTKLKELIGSIYELAGLYYKLNKIGITDLAAIKYLADNSVYEFNKAINLFVKDNNKEELFNYIKDYYIRYYLPAWKNRNKSIYTKFVWEINEAVYISLVRILF